MIDIEAELDELIDRVEALAELTSGRQQAAVRYAHRKLRVALRYQLVEQRAAEAKTHRAEIASIQATAKAALKARRIEEAS